MAEKPSYENIEKKSRDPEKTERKGIYGLCTQIENEERYRMIFEHSSLGMRLMDARTGLRRPNFPGQQAGAGNICIDFITLLTVTV